MPRARFLLILLLAVGGCQPQPPESAAPAPIAAPPAGATGTGDAAAGTTLTEAGPAAADALPAWGRPFFCTPLQPLPDAAPYCTRSIGQVDCWRRPPLTMPTRPGLADGRSSLTAAQAARRAQCWPGIL